MTLKGRNHWGPASKLASISKLTPHPDQFCYFLIIFWGHVHELVSVSRTPCLLLYKPPPSIRGLLAKFSLPIEFWEWVALPEALEGLPKQLKKPQLPGAE